MGKTYSIRGIRDTYSHVPEIADSILKGKQTLYTPDGSTNVNTTLDKATSTKNIKKLVHSHYNFLGLRSVFHEAMRKSLNESHTTNTGKRIKTNALQKGIRFTTSSVVGVLGGLGIIGREVVNTNKDEQYKLLGQYIKQRKNKSG